MYVYVFDDNNNNVYMGIVKNLSVNKIARSYYLSKRLRCICNGLGKC